MTFQKKLPTISRGQNFADRPRRYSSAVHSSPAFNNAIKSSRFSSIFEPAKTHLICRFLQIVLMQFALTADSGSAALISASASLKDADLIRDTREGKFIFYEINTTVLEETLLWIADLKGDNDHAEKE